MVILQTAAFFAGRIYSRQVSVFGGSLWEKWLLKIRSEK